jgi:hypothetical protein
VSSSGIRQSVVAIEALSWFIGSDELRIYRVLLHVVCIPAAHSAAARLNRNGRATPGLNAGGRLSVGCRRKVHRAEGDVLDLQEQERVMIQRALERFEGNRRRAGGLSQADWFCESHVTVPPMIEPPTAVAGSLLAASVERAADHWFKEELRRGSRREPLDTIGTQSVASSKDAEIVTYCGGPQCTQRTEAARKLAELRSHMSASTRTA